MARIFGYEFNNAIEGTMGSNTTTQAQSLLIQVRNSLTRKHLELIRVSIVQDFVDPVALTDRYARLIVCTGNLPTEDTTSAVALVPFFPLSKITSGIKGISRLLFSTVVKNEATIQFDPSLVVVEGEMLNVLLGVPYAVGDTMASPSASTATLSAIGREVIDGQDNFKYKMS